MIRSGLTKIHADRHDYSLVHTLAYAGALPDPRGLPRSFSIYDGRPIPNQNDFDVRFTPQLPPMPVGCTGETGSFESGLQDGVLYNPKDLYDNTPGLPGEGRDIRAMLQTLIDRGPRKADGTFGPKRTAYFNCYGSGKIDDFDAARIALWINQQEKRGVYVGSFWYPEFEQPVNGSGGDTTHVGIDGVLPVPASFNTGLATMHNHLVTGFESTYKDDYLEDISWQGNDYAHHGRDFISRELYNALMAQPWTGAFTITKTEGLTPIPIGIQANIDHLIYFIRNLFRV